ncbi:Ankyrin repeat family protein [Heracleum sosnowskyi]|uniref:Ankyrin repeat family protein n=1 Tax=Heracleum sosnowskyi TaxID=360622 RepID=A0AAD8JGQ1_9APIA|nr:Ankyrin repeat family protein [Heracleum sosnowskyi]
MSVPRRRNAIIQEQQESDSNAPPHLRHLDAALGNGDPDALRHALDNLVGSIDEPIENGDTALHLACVYGKLTCVQILLERGASLEAKDEDGEIPLHGACAAGTIHAMESVSCDSICLILVLVARLAVSRHNSLSSISCFLYVQNFILADPE